VWLHRLSKRALRIVVLLSALGLAAMALFASEGYRMSFGWSAHGTGLLGGFFRLSFSFSAGLLISRSFKPVRVRGSFWLCAAIIAAVTLCPYIGSEKNIGNVIYDLCCTLLVFPALVYLGACGNTTDRLSTATCRFVGQLSYPIYIIHYPVMYVFYGWVWSNSLTFDEVWPTCVAIFFGLIAAAWLVLRYYDTPLRAFLTRKFISHKSV